MVDFGGLKELKNWLEENFDHTLALDEDDPMLDMLRQLESWNLADIRVMKGVGCEKFAEHAFVFADKIIKEKTSNRCWVESVEVKEHGANSAIVRK